MSFELILGCSQADQRAVQPPVAFDPWLPPVAVAATCGRGRHLWPWSPPVAMAATCGRAASVAVAAIQPQCLPISFTRPMQFEIVVASTYAASIARMASAPAESKPKLRSRSWMSLTDQNLCQALEGLGPSWRSRSGWTSTCSHPPASMQYIFQHMDAKASLHQDIF